MESMTTWADETPGGFGMLSQTKARCFVIAVGLAFIVGGQTARAARKLHVVIAADENDASIGKYLSLIHI